MSDAVANAIAANTEAVRELAHATRQTRDLLENFWQMISPKHRAKILGCSTSAEWRRRKKSQLERLAAS